MAHTFIYPRNTKLTVVSGEHSCSKTSVIIAMYDVSTTRVFVRYKTAVLSEAVAMSLYDI